MTAGLEFSGGFYYSVARRARNFSGHAHFGVKPRPFLYRFGERLLALSVFDQDIC